MSDENDASTTDVIMWLRHWHIPFKRINLEENYHFSRMDISNNLVEMIIKNERQEISLSKVTSFWYRRGKLTLSLPKSRFVSEISEQIRNHLMEEFSDLENFFYTYLGKLAHIGTFHTRNVNKSEVLYEAKKVGLNIPITLITNNKADLKGVFQSNYITKGISKVFIPEIENEGYITYTVGLDNKKIPSSFFPSLFQDHIEKEADIRVFYLCGKFYSMAIRSQENIQTKTDFRKYDRVNPNRCVPFKLPLEIEDKLGVLMQKVNLETGSIDLILDKKGSFFFLEINPVGQFGMTSIPCNYYLEKKIANELYQISK